ncbi:MAG: PAS domain S-box protein [Pyrinomonadaceae bacterium]|nr:PAS domain S-box protein [Pyrinomonadaceae bacterium]
MFSLDEKVIQPKDSLINKIQLLIIGRLMALFLLLVGSWIWNSGHLKLSFEDFPQKLFLAFLIFVGLTIVYFFVLRLSKNYEWQIRIQFTLDALLITWLVWQTGDISSPYITLYTVLIAISGIFLRPRGTILLAIGCVSLFIALSITAIYSFVDSFGTAQTTSKTVQIIAFHAVACLVVGMLSARLSDRHASGDKLREAEKSLINLRALHERIVESIRSGLITTDLEGKIYTFNLAAEEITGSKSEEMIGKSVFDLLGDIEDTLANSIEQTEAGDHPLRFETDILTPDGFAVHIGYGISPLFDEDGKTTGLIITFQDLTEIRSMEESVRRKDRLAAVGRVAAGLAHEIRNPLGAMRGAIQVLQAQTPPESAQASLMEIILRESDRLNKIITNFLTYARPRVSNFSEIDLREAINDSVTLLQHSPDIQAHHILECEMPDEEIKISADPTQLKQIFWNLARNSIQAMPKGGKLSVLVQKPSINRVQIIFSDTGCGMSPEQVEQLFEPFSNSTTGGTGLGLSIVYQIIRDHNGTINVRSLEGEGTKITIELPADNRGQNPAPETGKIENNGQSSRLESFLTIKSEQNKISS